MKVFDKPTKAKLIEGIDHQGIGGKVIILEREMSAEEALNMNTIAAANFGNRRQDIIRKGIYDYLEMKDLDNKQLEEYKKEKDDAWNNITCYYGHVGNLGYFIAADEIDGELEEVDWNEASKYLNS